MADLEEIVRQGEGLKDRKLRLFGLRLSGASIVGAFAFIGCHLPRFKTGKHFTGRRRPCEINRFWVE